MTLPTKLALLISVAVALSCSCASAGAQGSSGDKSGGDAVGALMDCLTAKAKSIDNHVVDATMIAAAIADACPEQEAQVEQAFGARLTPEGQELVHERMVDDRQSTALKAVLVERSWKSN
jgi:hypothetical protein